MEKQYPWENCGSIGFNKQITGRTHSDKIMPRRQECHIVDWQNKERSAMLNYMCVAELRVDVTGALVDWKDKEMCAIFNHIK